MKERTGSFDSQDAMLLIERSLHFPFRRLGISDFPLQRLLILLACDRRAPECETRRMMERLPDFTKASMSRHLKALRELGLVEPREVSEDLRRKTWHLTRRGRRFMHDWRTEIERQGQRLRADRGP